MVLQYHSTTRDTVLFYVSKPDGQFDPARMHLNG